MLWRIRARADAELANPPDGCMDLIRGDVIGTFAGLGAARFAAGDVSEGIRFHPGGFAALFGVPASELVGLRVPFATCAAAFLAAASSPPTRARPTRWSAAALERRATCGACAPRHGYSERQLRRRIAESTGHGPKRLMQDRPHAAAAPRRPWRELGRALAVGARLLRRSAHGQRRPRPGSAPRRTRCSDVRFFLVAPTATTTFASSPTRQEEPMKIEFIASFAVDRPDPAKSRELYVDALGLPLEATDGDGYFHSEQSTAASTSASGR